MAADASIRVNTKVDNSDLGKLQKDFDSLDRKLQKLYERGEKLEALGVDKKSKQWKSLQYDVAQTEMKMEELAETMAEVEGLGLDDTAEGFDKASNASKKCFNNIAAGSKKSDGLLKKLTNKIGKLAIGFFIWQQATKAFRTMLNAMKDGFENIASFSTDYNKAMSDLKSQLATLKNAMAAAFEPIVSAVIPYITQLIQYMNVAIDKIGQFLSALRGKNTYTKAKKQIIDYAKALDKAGKSAKGALASFDQLNILDKGNAGGELIGADAFETAQVESKISSFAERVKDIIAPVKQSFSNMIGEIDYQPLLGSLGRLKDSISPLVGDIGSGLVWLLDNVLKPIAGFYIGDYLPAYFDTLSAASNALHVAIEKMSPGLEYIYENVIKPMGEYAGKELLGFLESVQKMFADVAGVIDEKGEKINDILVGLGMTAEYLWVFGFKPVLDFIIGGFEELLGYVDDIIGDIIDICHGLTEFLVGVFTGDWDRAWSGIKEIFTGIWNLIIDVYEACVNAIIGGLNKISIDVPEWIPGVGGQHWGFNLQEMHLPRLAEGAVIPGGRPFAAILGDQRPGQTNIETPLATMVEAFKQASAESGGEYTFIANIDGREIFRETVRQDQMYRNRSGRSAFAF